MVLNSKLSAHYIGLTASCVAKFHPVLTQNFAYF